MRRNWRTLLFAAVLAAALVVHQAVLHSQGEMGPPLWQSARDLSAGRQLRADDLVAPPGWFFRGPLPSREDLIGRFLGRGTGVGRPLSRDDTLLLPPDAGTELLVFDIHDRQIRHALESGVRIRACIGSRCLVPVEVVSVHYGADGGAEWAALRMSIDNLTAWTESIANPQAVFVVSEPSRSGVGVNCGPPQPAP